MDNLNLKGSTFFYTPCIINKFKKSLIIHEENIKKITTVSVVLYMIKFHVNLHAL